MDDLKIYCKCEEDQSVILDFIFSKYQNKVKYSTWEPDLDGTGTWGMFIDDFPYPTLWDKLVEFLDNKTSSMLKYPVEMAIEDGSISYPLLV